MNEIDDLRAQAKDNLEVQLGVSVADMAFFEAVVGLLKRMDANAGNTIKQVLEARKPTLQKGQSPRTAQVIDTRIQVIQSIADQA